MKTPVKTLQETLMETVVETSVFGQLSRAAGQAPHTHPATNNSPAAGARTLLPTIQPLT